MEITEIRVFLAEEDRLKAYVTITFDNCFVVRDLKVIRGNSGLFVAMPSKKKKDGSYKDIAHPINSDFRKSIEDKIIAAFNDESKMVEAGFPVKKEDDYEQDSVSVDSGHVPSSPMAEFEAGVGPSAKKD
jgi:stage V sporulation protein G